jgi:hypothetical protein
VIGQDHGKRGEVRTKERESSQNHRRRDTEDHRKWMVRIIEDEIVMIIGEKRARARIIEKGESQDQRKRKSVLCNDETGQIMERGRRQGRRKWQDSGS